MSRYRFVSTLEAEELVLGYLGLLENKIGSASAIDSTMLRFGDETMALREVEAALERCVELGDVERVESALKLYRMTAKGMARVGVK